MANCTNPTKLPEMFHIHLIFCGEYTIIKLTYVSVWKTQVFRAYCVFAEIDERGLDNMEKSGGGCIVEAACCIPIAPTDIKKIKKADFDAF